MNEQLLKQIADSLDRIALELEVMNREGIVFFAGNTNEEN